MTTALSVLSNTNLALVPGTEEAEKTASHMAREYQEATTEMARLMLAIDTQAARICDAFVDADGSRGLFNLHFSYDGNNYISATNPADMFTKMKRRAWRILADRIGIKNVMSVAKRKEFENQLERGDLPEISEEAILGTIGGLIGQAQNFAAEAAKEVFDILRPHSREYTTNDPFRVGRKVILQNRVERCYDGKKFRPNYYHEQDLIAMDGIFHILDGKGPMRENRGPLVKAINDSPDGKGETEYFAFKAFKNRNLHLTMKRLDLVMDLNMLAAGERILGCDME